MVHPPRPSPQRRGPGPAHNAVPSGRSTSPPRSGSATPVATSRSPPSSASGIPTSRSTGWRRTRSPACSPAAGETVHPASKWLANESAHIEDECAEHDLHAFQAIRRMDEILVNNFMVFNEVVEETHYDLVIGDEAWDVDYFLHENPELKRFAFAWMTDFVGWLPMPSGGADGGGAHRRLQRRDDRAARPPPPAARPVDLRRQPRRRRRRVLRSRPARHPGVDERQLRLRRLRLRLHPARRGGVRSAALPPRLPRGRPRLPGHRGRFRGGRLAAAPGPGRRTPRATARPRAEVPRRVRSPDRSRLTAAVGRA